MTIISDATTWLPQLKIIIDGTS